MKVLPTILLIVALLCIALAVIAKLFIGILFNVKPVSYIVFANTCLLISLVVKDMKK